MDIIVIGGGASGLVAALFAKNNNNNVTILERFDSCAKKILVTGNGRCNYWNEDFNNNSFSSHNIDFIKEFNKEENRKEVLEFFESIGIVPTIKNGYYYPMSREASSIKNALLNEVKRKNIKIINNVNVLSVNKINNKFEIVSNNNKYYCDKLIMATGSNSYYKEETTGYNICKSLGHNIIPLLPGLVQLIAKDNYFKESNGVRCNSKVSIYVDNILQKEEYGEVQLTDYGLTGICIFNLSNIANESLHNNKEVYIKINFLPEIDNIIEFLEKRNNNLKESNLQNFLEGIINHKLINTILKRTNLENRSYSSLNDKEKELLIDNLTNFKVNIIGSKSFEFSQTSLGGVDTREIDSNTFESKKCKNLYIVGELLDVSGLCGGFNLGFAWISGMIAGKSVRND